MNNENKILEAIIENFRNEYKLSKRQNIFNIFTAYEICKDKGITIEDAIDSCIDGGGDGGIDNIFVFINGLYIKTSEDYNAISNNINSNSTLEIEVLQNKETTGFSGDVFQKLSNTFQNIFSENVNDNILKTLYKEELIEQINLFRKINNDIVKFNSSRIYVNIYYSTKSNRLDISSYVKNNEDSLINIINDNLCISNTKVIYNGIKELKQLHDKGTISNLNLKFEKNILSTYMEEKNEACILLVGINDYYKFITDHNEVLKTYLFDNNIRDYQENTNLVNKDIIDTLNKPSNIDFWWLNNGITILVDNLEIKPNSLNLTSPRIVNGLQTSYCIYEKISKEPPIFKDNIKENRNLLVKVIKVNNEKVMEDIILATNNQTPINTSDLIANNKIQKDIEELFKSKGYYYERRNNYYSRQVGISKSKIIDKMQLLQYCISILQKSPSIARSNPKTIIYKGNYNQILNDKIEMNIYLNLCVIAEKLNGYINSIEKDNDVLYKNYGASIISFKLHIFLIIIILILKNNNFKSENIKDINISDINEDIFYKSVDIIDKILKQSNTTNKLYYAKTKQIDIDIINYNYNFKK